MDLSSLSSDVITAITNGGFTSIVMFMFAITVGGGVAGFLRHMDQAHERYSEDLERVVQGFEKAMIELKMSDQKVVDKVESLERTMNQILMEIARKGNG